MNDTVKISLTLKRDTRSTEDMAIVESIVSRLGGKITGHGSATLSARLPMKKFEEVFGISPESRSAEHGGDSDFGTPPGYFAEDIPIPAELASRIEFISIEPPATRM